MKNGLLHPAHPSSPGSRQFHRFITAVETLPTLAQYAIAGALIVLVFALDFVTGPEVAFSIFYLLPVTMLAWHRGFIPACIGVFVCGLAWLLADVLNENEYSYAAIQYWNAFVRTTFFFIVAYILVQLRRAVTEEQRLARTDDLTGAANSRWFIAIVAAEIARHRRYHHPLSLIFLDCDNFKEVNDGLGHAAGDDLLRRIAAAIHGSMREVDVVARLGGDEFAVLLPESDDQVAAHVTTEITRGLAAAVGDHNVTFSMGVVTCYELPTTVDALIATADQAMYEAKNAGKNTARYRMFGDQATRTAKASRVY